MRQLQQPAVEGGAVVSKRKKVAIALRTVTGCRAGVKRKKERKRMFKQG